MHLCLFILLNLPSACFPSNVLFVIVWVFKRVYILQKIDYVQWQINGLLVQYTIASSKSHHILSAHCLVAKSNSAECCRLAILLLVDGMQ